VLQVGTKALKGLAQKKRYNFLGIGQKREKKALGQP
jgi:hypothetical protein